MDKLIQGGFEKGSIILVSGGTGTGKTIFGLQFLYEGAKKGERVLYVTFEESASDLKKDAKVLGMDVEKFGNKFMIKEYPPFGFEDFLSDLPNLLKKKVSRLVVDSISAFGIYIKDPFELRKKIYNFAQLVKEAGVTSLMLSEITGESTMNVQTASFSRFGVEEFVADGVVVLHYAGLGGGYDRSIQIVKMRRTRHARGLFPMKITDQGIKVQTKVI